MFSNCFMRKYYRKSRSRGVPQRVPRPTFLCLPSSVHRKPQEKRHRCWGWSQEVGRKKLEGAGEGGLTWRSNCWRKSSREKGENTWWKGVISEKARGSSGRDSSVAGEGKEAVKDYSKRLNIVSWEDWDCVNRNKGEHQIKPDSANKTTLISDQKERVCSSSNSIAVTYLLIHIS